MPRQPRLDAPGILHHIMGRGIEGTKIFRNKADRDDFLSRMADLCQGGAWVVYAWALIPNHFLCGAPHNIFTFWLERAVNPFRRL